MDYALWVRRYLETMPDSKQRLAQGFEEIPEVKDVLEKHLTPAYDSSLAIRSVYGRWLPWLLLLDSQWTKAHLENIFTRKDGQKLFRQVAWQTYIVFCRPYDNVYDLLQQEYALAISELGSYEEQADRHGNPEEHLAQHLIQFYWRGKIDLNVPSNLLPVFYQQASDMVCSDIIEYGGRSLKNTEGEVESDILDRFKKLWEYRFKSIALDTSTNSHLKELAAFGWWFGSKKFKVEWALPKLLGVLSITKKIKPEHLVIKYLVETATNMPNETIECLDLMIQGDEEGWHVHIWEKEIRAILTSVKQTGNSEVQQSADSLINKLGAKGYFGYRELLEIPAIFS